MLIRHQAIIWGNVSLLLIWHFGTNVREILLKIHQFPCTKINLKMSPAEWRQFSIGINVLNNQILRYSNVQLHVAISSSGLFYVEWYLNYESSIKIKVSQLSWLQCSHHTQTDENKTLESEDPATYSLNNNGYHPVAFSAVDQSIEANILNAQSCDKYSYKMLCLSIVNYTYTYKNIKRKLSTLSCLVFLNSVKN